VPTLARAALLHENFRPPVPINNPGKIRRDYLKNNDQTKKKVDDTQDDIEGTERDARTVVDAAEGDATSQIEVGREVIGLLRFNSKKKKPRYGVDPTFVATEDVIYIRDLMQQPIREMVGDSAYLVSVFDHATPGMRERVWDIRPRTPYHQVQTPLGSGKFMRSSSWAMQMYNPESEVRSTMMSPAHLPTEGLAGSELKQVWRRRKTSDWNFGGGLGFVPYRHTKYSCNDFEPDDARRWGGSVAQCSLGGSYAPKPSEVEGLSLDLNAINVQWLVGDRRFAIEFGPEAHLDVLMPGQSLFYDGDRPQTGITSLNEDGEPEDIGGRTPYDWSFRVQGGVLVGLRFAPNPAPLWRARGKRYPWGSPLPDGSSTLGRMQFGLRAGFLLGPSFDGFEGTAITEAWMGWAVRAARGKQATFTPYHPAVLFGPFVRGQVGLALVPNPARYLKLDYTAAVIVGLRAQFRLTAQPELKVEAPEI
jgi:hypothetical protein